MRYFQQGFTLIELLIVISVVGVLAAAILVMVNPLAQINKAQNANLQLGINQMVKSIDLTRISYDNALGNITASWCSSCSCRCVDARSDTTCLNVMNNAWSKVSSKPLPRDPWGNIYMWDENELESTGTCPGYGRDALISAGPDHIHGSGSCPTNDDDDTIYWIPYYKCQ